MQSTLPVDSSTHMRSLPPPTSHFFSLHSCCFASSPSTRPCNTNTVLEYQDYHSFRSLPCCFCTRRSIALGQLPVEDRTCRLAKERAFATIASSLGERLRLCRPRHFETLSDRRVLLPSTQETRADPCAIYPTEQLDYQADN